MNLENIPEYLKENASWCLWKYEARNNRYKFKETDHLDILEFYREN